MPSQIFETHEVQGHIARTTYDIPQRNQAGEIVRASPSYLAVDPWDIAHKLANAGMETQVVSPKRRTMGCSVKWTKVVQVTQRTGPLYLSVASIFCDHRGKRAVLGMPSAWRRSCANEFNGAPMRLHHCGQEVRDFVRDPVPFVRKLLDESFELSMQAEWDSRSMPQSPELWLELDKYPRLQARVLGWRQYYAGEARKFNVDPESAWVQIQALTHVKSPITVELAAQYLAGKWPVSQ